MYLSLAHLTLSQGGTDKSVRLRGGAKQHLLSLSCCLWQRVQTMQMCGWNHPGWQDVVLLLLATTELMHPAYICIHVCTCVIFLVDPWLQRGRIHFSMAIRVSVSVHILRRVRQLATRSHSFVCTRGIFCVVRTFLFSKKGIRECPHPAVLILQAPCVTLQCASLVRG